MTVSGDCSADDRLTRALTRAFSPIRSVAGNVADDLELAVMNWTRILIVAAAFAATGIVASGAAFAQTQAPSAQPSIVVSSTKDVETWTTEQWNAAKANWAENSVKWSECQKQSGTRKLEGRASWSFLYSCMTS